MKPSRVSGAGASRADRADPARRRAARRRDPQRHAGGRDRAWACGCGSPGSCSGRSAMPPRSGPPSAIRCSSTWCAGTCATPPISDREERDDEPRRISQEAATPRRLSALGGAGRQGRRPQQGRQLSADGALPRARISIARRRPSWSERRRGSTMRCAGLGSGWAIFVEAQPRCRPTTIREASFPDAVSALVDAERKAQFEEEGAHFESAYYLTFVFLPPAEDAARAEAWLYEGRRARGRRRAARCSRVSSTAPTGCCSSSRVSCRRPTGSMTRRR